MIKIAFVAVALVLMASAVVAQNPPIPQLPQAFASNFTLDFPGWNLNPNDKFVGFLELDAINGGGRFHIQGEEVLPFYFETSAIAIPQLANESVTAYLWYPPTCWFSNHHVDFLKFWPVKLPSYAQFGGYNFYDDIKVQTWKWDAEDGSVEIWVDDAEPHAVRKVIVGYPFILGQITAVWSMTQVKVGPVNPAEFKVPAGLQCTWQGGDNVAVAPRDEHALPKPFGNVVANPLQRLMLTAGSAVMQKGLLSSMKQDGLLKTLLRARRREHQEKRIAYRPAGLQLLRKLGKPNTVHDPTPPKLSQKFQANYVVVGTYPGTTFKDQQVASGVIAVDYTTYGGSVTLNSTETPVLLSTNIVAHPHGEIVTGYIYAGDICYSADVGQDFIEQWPLRIPADAKYMGDKVINGDKCQGWQFDALYDSLWTYWVRDSDNALVRIESSDPDLVDGNVEITMSKISFDVPASAYEPPKVQCKRVF